MTTTVIQALILREGRGPLTHLRGQRAEGEPLSTFSGHRSSAQATSAEGSIKVTVPTGSVRLNLLAQVPGSAPRKQEPDG